MTRAPGLIGHPIKAAPVGVPAGRLDTGCARRKALSKGRYTGVRGLAAKVWLFIEQPFHKCLLVVQRLLAGQSLTSQRHGRLHVHAPRLNQFPLQAPVTVNGDEAGLEGLHLSPSRNQFLLKTGGMLVTLATQIVDLGLERLGAPLRFLGTPTVLDALPN